MNKMPMCRICLVENIRMYIVNDKDLQQLYEKLTDIPFVTEDNRPMLACFICCTKLKQCCQLQRKCLEAEELFAQMMNEPNLSVNRGQLKYSSGLIVTPVENISIVDVSHIENIAVKEELPAVCERLDDVIEPEEEHFKYELELEPLNNSCSDAKDIPAQQSKPDPKYDVPLIEIKVEDVEEEQEVPSKKRRASDMTLTITNRPSIAQMECLVEFLEQNPGIAKGLLRTTQGKLETKRKWANLAKTINSLGGVNKDGQGWAKYWAEKKCALKKQCAQLSASMRRTDGGPAEYSVSLSTLDNRLVAVMGGHEFATSDSRSTINPFPTRAADSPVVVEESLPKDTEMTAIDVTPILDPSHNETISASSTIPVCTAPLPTAPPRRHHRTSTQRPQDVNMEQFTNIEQQRVDAEMLTAQAFAQLTEHIGTIASALTLMANAISEIARKMPDP